MKSTFFIGSGELPFVQKPKASFLCSIESIKKLFSKAYLLKPKRSIRHHLIKFNKLFWYDAKKAYCLDECAQYCWRSPIHAQGCLSCARAGCCMRKLAAWAGAHLTADDVCVKHVLKNWNLLYLKALILSVHLSYSRLIPHSHGKHFFSFLFVVLNSNISDRHLRHLLKTSFLLSFHHFKFSLLKYWEVRILTQASCAESKRMRDSIVPHPLIWSFLSLSLLCFVRLLNKYMKIYEFIQRL